ncbi:MAG TPA: helix-turn-helix domain-containing protein [Roseiarcus sp.]|nr:helix-turn-helix domain-containing protein [Roseiarcus sp.]
MANLDGGLRRAGETETSAAGGATDKGAKRSRRPDALGTSGHERVASQGCPHCAGRAIVAWGRSHGLSRFRCKSCGRTFNALTKTAMAHLRKKEKWLDHARAMIEGRSLAKTAELCGVHPTTAFRWRHRFLGAPAATSQESCAESSRRTKPSSSNPSRAGGLICRARLSGLARHPGLHSDTIPVLVARDRRGATFDAVLAAETTALRSERRWPAS